MKKILITIFTLFAFVLSNGQDRTSLPKIELDCWWKLEIPEKSYWSNLGYIGRYDPELDKWTNRDGVISVLYLATVKNYPDYCILIVPNIQDHYEEHVSVKITGYDQVTIHAYPGTFQRGCSYFVFPKKELRNISQSLRIYSENGGDCYSEFKILTSTFDEKIKFWEKYYTKKYQKKLNKEGYDCPSYGTYFSIKQWKDKIRFNTVEFRDLLQNIDSNVKLESGYYEISLDSWLNFINNLK